MVQHALSETGRPSETVREPPRKRIDRRHDDAIDLGHLFVGLLDAQMRHGLELAAALGQMALWGEIVRAQVKLVRASLGWWSRSDAASAAQPDRGGSAPSRGRGLPVRAVVEHRCPVVAEPDDTVQAAVMRMTEEGCGSVLVCDGDELRGIFTERDLLTRVVGRGLDPKTTRLAEVMTRDPARIESAASTREALRQLDGFAHHELPVVEEGRALGVFSLRDVPLETLAEMLPELEQRRALAERMW